jgi:hypothetical protein
MPRPMIAAAMTVILASLALFNSAAKAEPAKQFKAGDRVLARWGPEKFWYAGTVREVKGTRYVIGFDDGDKQETPGEEVIADDIKVGDKVQGNFKRAGKYFPGKITTRTGDQIHIKYDDGDEEDTTIGMVRVERPRA